MKKHCILVVEDQEDLAELYMATLTKGGYDVRIAYTGEEGIAELGSVKPSNAVELLGVANVDGALVGGASLKSADFLGIAEAYLSM